MIPRELLEIDFQAVTIVSTLTRMSLAALFGGLVGMERGRKRRAAGLRTHMLVCMGATLVMITNQYIAVTFDTSDPSRMGAQVISGIGFLGVGTIIVDRQQQVRGLTTAAGLWSCACVGLAVGIGFYFGAIVAIAFILSTIIILNRLEHRIIRKSRVMEAYGEFEGHQDINRFIGLVSQNGIKVMHLEIVKPRGRQVDDNTRAAAVMTFYLPKRYLHTQVLDDLESTPGLQLIEEII